LPHVLKFDALFYEEVRANRSWDKDAPNFRCAPPLGNLAALPILDGLRHLDPTGLSFRRTRVSGGFSPAWAKTHLD
jgi:hypothetical protein